MKLLLTRPKKVPLVLVLDNMIRQGVVGIAAAYMHCKVVSIRREATLLLGLLMSSPTGLSKMSINETFTGIKKLLFDDEL